MFPNHSDKDFPENDNSERDYEDVQKSSFSIKDIWNSISPEIQLFILLSVKKAFEEVQYEKEDIQTDYILTVNPSGEISDTISDNSLFELNGASDGNIGLWINPDLDLYQKKNILVKFGLLKEKLYHITSEDLYAVLEENPRMTLLNYKRLIAYDLGDGEILLRHAPHMLVSLQNVSWGKLFNDYKKEIAYYQTQLLSINFFELQKIKSFSWEETTKDLNMWF